MAEADATAPIIIKKVKKGGHGHHGGAWKVAYADFVTAMMAFFLLLWLLNATTDEQKAGIADYFSPASLSKSYSGSGGVMGGTSVNPKGALRSDNAQPVGVTVALPNPGSKTDGEPGEDLEATGDGSAADADRLSEEELRRELAEREAAQFAQAAETLRTALQANPELHALSDAIRIDQTPDGLRIQIVDQAGKSMFPLGSDEMFAHTRKLMEMVASAVAQLPHHIAIRGHTDASPFVAGNGYSNWELSSDRANSSRRALLQAGLPPERIASVTGRADQDPLLPEDPFSPNNRRISIILLREAPVAMGANSGLKAGPPSNPH